MKNQAKPLSVLMEETHTKLTIMVNKIIEDSKLPAYLIEGMLLGLLSDVREQKARELISDMRVSSVTTVTETEEANDESQREDIS